MKIVLSLVTLIGLALSSTACFGQIQMYAPAPGEGQQYVPPQGQQYVPPQGEQYVPPQGQQYLPPQGQQQYQQLLGSNPIVNQTHQATVYYDQNGNPIVHSQTGVLQQSHLNPGAHNVVGQKQYVDRIEYVNGVQVRVTGYQWMGADGLMHGQLNRRSVTNQGGTTVIDDSLHLFQK